MSLTVDIERAPIILCGPMLRKTTPQSVSVFVALKQACNVQLFIHSTPDPDSETINSASGPGDQPVRTIALGKNLHVLCVTLDSPDPFLEPGRVYGYDLRITPVDGSAITSLGELGLLEGECPLGYSPGLLPSFALPPDKLRDLKLVHGSCRKPHGEGEDMLTKLDDIIKDDRDDPYYRPHQLFLTGDQIYADDVALPLLRVLTETGKMLLGWDEDMPDSKGDTAFSLLDQWDSPSWPRGGPRRESFVGLETGYTSGHRDGHLMFLAEFYAMYLMAWSDVLWPKLPDQGGSPSYTLPEFGLLVMREDWGPSGLAPINRLSVGLGTSQRYASDDAEPKLRRQRAAILEFAQALPRVRRALANVPTYMIFDDHEITDDWNLNGDWVKRVRASFTGRRLLRNGLLAYALFQDWGNQPHDYSQDFGLGRFLLGKLKCPEGPGQGPCQPPAIHGVPHDPGLERTLDIGEINQETLPRMGEDQSLSGRKLWNYTVDGPEHRVIALDTRTWREFPAGSGRRDNGPPALINASSLRDQLQWSPNPDCQHVVVSSAPFIGLPIVEEVAQRIYADISGPEASDLEAWGANREAFELTLLKLSGRKRTIILSGDVHYGFSNQLAYFKDALGSARVVQLCSSALKNEDFKTRLLGKHSDKVTRESEGWIAFDRSLEHLKQDVWEQFALPENWQGPSIGDLPSDGRSVALPLSTNYFNIVREHRLEAPAVIPTVGWGETLAKKIREIESSVYSPDSLWRYSVTYLRDERPDQIWPFVIGTNNIGCISFQGEQGDDDENVYHKLWWFLPERRAYVSTLHVAKLQAPTNAEYPEVSE